MDNRWVKIIMNHWWNDPDRRVLKYLEKKSLPVPFRPPQISHNLDLDSNTFLRAYSTTLLNFYIKFIKKNPTRYKNVSIFLYYFLFIWSSTCLGRHTAHHQEPKTALAASGFSYVEGAPSHTVPDNVQQLQVHQPSTYEKPEAASTVLGSSWWGVCHPKHVELHINRE
jgi:hypothetical protein